MPKKPQQLEIASQEPKRRGRPPKDTTQTAPANGASTKKVAMENPGNLSYNQLVKFYQENQGAVRQLSTQAKEAEKRVAEQERQLGKVKISILKIASAFENVVNSFLAGKAEVKPAKAAGRPKKEKEVVADEIETAPKKRGRPKATAMSIETAPVTTSEAPKKRGRPPKATAPSFLAPKVRKNVEAAKNGIKKAKAVQVAYAEDQLD